MIDKLSDPVATAEVSWIEAERGGRKTGPPTAPVYAATAVFITGDEQEVQPGWPANASQISILLECAGESPGGSSICNVDFLVRELAYSHLHPGVEMLVMEGPRTVAKARILSVRPREGTDEDRP